MKSGAPSVSPAPVPFFARPTAGAVLVVRSGVHAGETRTKASEDLYKVGG